MRSILSVGGKFIMKLGKLLHLGPFGHLPGTQKRLHQICFATYGHSRESFEPFATRNVWLTIKPIGEATKFFGCDVSRPNAIDKMIKQRWRQILPANLRHAIARRRSHGRCSLEQPRLQSRLSHSRAAQPTWTVQVR